MAEKAPELHVKGLLASLDQVGKSADAITERAQQLAASPVAPPASAPKNGAGGPPK